MVAYNTLIEVSTSNTGRHRTLRNLIEESYMKEGISEEIWLQDCVQRKKKKKTSSATSMFGVGFSQF